MRIARLTMGVVALSLSVGLLPTTAWADDPPCYRDPVTGQEVCNVGAGGGSSTPGSPGVPGARSSRKATCSRTDVFPESAQRVPCSHDGDPWVQDRQCYMHLYTPQPDKSLKVWANHWPDGAIYYCYAPWRLVNEQVWLATPPQTPVDPELLAEEIVKQMALRKVDIGLAPKPGANSLGLVGVPVYMWVAQPSPQTIGPMSRSASAGGVTVTATARVQRFVWNMGDGRGVTCTGPGTPYSASFGFKPSPTCGYKYTSTSAGRPGDAYTVSATSYWRVVWTGGGENGWFEFSLTNTAPIRV